MIKHIDLGESAFSRCKKLKQLLNAGTIQFAGNANIKIYGKLSCRSGKRMKLNNRVFFVSEAEAQQLNYRPCGHCMHTAYLQWLKERFKHTILISN